MNSDFITVVCGLPRCGSSLTMQMLDAAGLRCGGTYPDYEPDEIAAPPAEWVDSLVGGAFKLLNPHFVPLPRGRKYRFIFLTRSRRQQATSMVKIMKLSGNFTAAVSDAQFTELEDSLRRDEAAALVELARHDAPVLKVRFEDLVARPGPTVWRIADFIDSIRGAEMESCVMPRTASCYPGLLEIDLLEAEEERTAADDAAERGDREFKLRQEDEA